MPRHPAQNKALERYYEKRKDATEKCFRDAIDRLVSGEPLHSKGRLTEADLCREAQRSRATLNRYPHIKVAFSEAKKNRNKTAPTNLIEKVRELEETLRQNRRQDNKKIRDIGESRDRYAQEVYILNCVIGVLRADMAEQKSRLEEALKGSPLRLVVNNATQS